MQDHVRINYVILWAKSFYAVLLFNFIFEIYILYL